MMRTTMQQIDAALPQLTRFDTTLAAVADSAPQHLTIWLQDSVVRKLQVAPDSGANGPSLGELDFWFIGGEVAVVQETMDMYAFDGGRIVLWTDESLQPRTDVTTPFVMAKETDLDKMVRRWLAVFRVTLP